MLLKVLLPAGAHKVTLTDAPTTLAAFQSAVMAKLSLQGGPATLKWEIWDDDFSPAEFITMGPSHLQVVAQQGSTVTIRLNPAGSLTTPQKLKPGTKQISVSSMFGGTITRKVVLGGTVVREIDIAAADGPVRKPPPVLQCTVGNPSCTFAGTTHGPARSAHEKACRKTIGSSQTHECHTDGRTVFPVDGMPSFLYLIPEGQRQRILDFALHEPNLDVTQSTLSAKFGLDMTQLQDLDEYIASTQATLDDQQRFSDTDLLPSVHSEGYYVDTSSSDDGAGQGLGAGKKRGRRGANRRKRYNPVFKLQVCAEYERCLGQEQAKTIKSALIVVSPDYKIGKSNVSNWWKKREAIKLFLELGSGSKFAPKKGKTAAGSHKRGNTTTAGRALSMQVASTGGKFPLAETRVTEQRKQKREKGCRVKGYWLRIQMKHAVSELYGAQAAALFKASRKWLRGYAGRSGISLQRKSNGKSQTAAERLPKVRRWHARFRIRLNRGTVASALWGRWLPQGRLFTDQVPFNLREGADVTYNDIGAERCWIRGCKQDDRKRFGTLQLTSRGKNGDTSKLFAEQPRPEICFRGQGKRLTLWEKNNWDPNCIVVFQPKAWYDRANCVRFAESSMAEYTAEARAAGRRSCGFFDNLDGQTTTEFISTLSTAASCDTHLLPSGCTDLVQFTDDGLGKAVKDRMGVEQDEDFIGNADLLDRWGDGKVSASEKRVLLTKWYVWAYDHVCRKWDFEKHATNLGMLLTADGSGDHLLKISGAPGYSFSASDAGEVDEDKMSDIDEQVNDAAPESDAGSERGGDAGGAGGSGSSSDGGGGSGAAALTRSARRRSGRGGGDSDSATEANSSDDDDDERDDTREVPGPSVPGGFVSFATDFPGISNGLIGKSLLYKWNLEPPRCGWFLGRVARAYTGTRMDLNYVIQFDIGFISGTNPSFLTEEGYGSGESDQHFWVLLEK